LVAGESTIELEDCGSFSNFDPIIVGELCECHGPVESRSVNCEK
jgi:hypothetical protein